MNIEQVVALAILGVTIALFIFSKWRHDAIAVISLSLCVFTGIIPQETVFSGFNNPAVITVACVLIMSYSLQFTGAIDVVTDKLLPSASSPTLTIAWLTSLAALLSAFMNNIGAMALLMPVAIQLANRLSIAPGQVLMPVAFGTILGGMTTLIGTPPNIIVAEFRTEYANEAFGMFDFTPVGLTVAVIGIIFISLVGWRLVPARERQDAATFDTGRYLTEVKIVPDSKAVGMSVWELEQAIEGTDGQLLGMVRDGEKVITPHWNKQLQIGDILVIEAEPEKMSQLLASHGLSLLEHMRQVSRKQEKLNLATIRELHREGETEEPVLPNTENFEDYDQSVKKQSSSWFDRRVTVLSKRTLRGFQVGMRDPENPNKIGVPVDTRDIVLVEMVVLPTSKLIQHTAQELQLRSRYGLNILAISRHGKHSIERLRKTKISAGDVILIQGEAERLANFANQFGCVPLAERTVRVPSKRRAVLATGVMLSAILSAASGLAPAEISFGMGVAAIMAFRLIPLRQLYESIDWSIIVLLAALIPVAGALQTTGAADIIADTLLYTLAQGHALFALGLILLLSMTLTDFMNNAATAAVMCPIAISSATQLGVSPDSFLMAVAIGVSCAFLTPIGHQNNTLILGPGGFRFGDYWRLGLPLEILVFIISIIMLPIIWPLHA